MTLKNTFGKCSLFVLSAKKRSKHGLFVFSPKKTLIWRRHCSIGQSCCSMTSKRSISWLLESSRAWSVFTRAFAYNQPKATRVCIRSTNQSNRSISVLLLFLLCSRVFISRSYENRSKRFSVNEVSGSNFSACRKFVRCRVNVAQENTKNKELTCFAVKK